MPKDVTTHVEDKQRVLGIHDLARAERGNLFGLFMPPLVAPFLHAHLAACPLEDEDVLDKGAVLERGIDD